MITKNMFTRTMGGVLLSGAVAFAQQEQPQASAPGAAVDRPQAPCGAPAACGFEGRSGPGVCPAGMGPMRQRGMGFGGAAGREPGRGFEGAAGPQMRQRGLDREGAPGAGVNPEIAKRAGATDQQIEALKTFAYEQEIKRVDLKAAVEKADLALKHLMQSEAVEAKTALTAADALSAARGELFKQEIASRVKVREILGEAVMKKMHEMRPADGVPPREGGAGCPTARGPQAQPGPDQTEQRGNPPHAQDNK